MKEMNRSNAKMMMKEMTEAMSAIAEKHNVEITSKGASFSTSEGTFKFKVTVNEAVAEAGGTNEEKAYDIYAKMYGMPARGETFKAGFDTFRTHSWASKAKKYPVIAVNVSNGKKYKFAVERVKACM